MTIRCLSHPDHAVWPKTGVVPKNGLAANEARGTLGQFLDATLMRPLVFDDGQRHQQIEDALDTMTWAERIAIEIELQTRNAPVHSFEYDPLKG